MTTAIYLVWKQKGPELRLYKKSCAVVNDLADGQRARKEVENQRETVWNKDMILDIKKD